MIDKGLFVMQEEPQARRRQVLTFAAWAIQEILQDYHTGAMSELMFAQKTGADLGPAAAKITVIEDLRATFNSQIIRENK